MGCGASWRHRSDGEDAPESRAKAQSGSFLSDAAPDSRRKQILRETFNALDSDGNGHVDMSEFLAGAKQGSSDYDVLKRLFEFVDDADDRDGRITFDEWQVMGEASWTVAPHP